MDRCSRSSRRTPRTCPRPSSSVRPWEWQTVNAPLFDPTGRFLAYTKQRPLGAPTTIAEHTVIHELATGREREWPEPHPHPGGWSPDGSSIVGWRHDGRIYICTVDDGSCRQLTTGGAAVWSAANRRIYFVRPADSAQPQELWSVTENGSEERREADLGSFRSIDRSIQVSRDGFLVWAPFRAGRHEIWTAMIK